MFSLVQAVQAHAGPSTRTLTLAHALLTAPSHTSRRRLATTARTDAYRSQPRLPQRTERARAGPAAGGTREDSASTSASRRSRSFGRGRGRAELNDLPDDGWDRQPGQRPALWSGVVVDAPALERRVSGDWSNTGKNPNQVVKNVDRGRLAKEHQADSNKLPIGHDGGKVASLFLGKASRRSEREQNHEHERYSLRPGSSSRSDFGSSSRSLTRSRQFGLVNGPRNNSRSTPFASPQHVHAQVEPEFNPTTASSTDPTDTSKRRWLPTRKLTYSGMAGLRELHAQDPDQFTRSVLAKKYGISFEAVSRILRSTYRDKVSSGGGGGVGGAADGSPGGSNRSLGKWDRNLETSESLSPVPYIRRAFELKRESERQAKVGAEAEGGAKDTSATS